MNLPIELKLFIPSFFATMGNCVKITRKTTDDNVISEDISDDLSELASDAVPDEVRKWLASTFAKQEQVL